MSIPSWHARTPQTLPLDLVTEPHWAKELVRTPTLPGSCCQEYLRHITAGGAPPRLPKAVRVQKSLFIFPRRVPEFASIEQCLVLLATRKRQGEPVTDSYEQEHPDKEWVPGYKVVVLTIKTGRKHDLDYLAALVKARAYSMNVPPVLVYGYRESKERACCRGIGS